MRHEDVSSGGAEDAFRGQDVRGIVGVVFPPFGNGIYTDTSFFQIYGFAARSGTFDADLWVEKWLGRDSGLTGLISLDFSWQKLTDKGVAQLASASSTQSVLQSLILAGTGITDVGLKELSRADTRLKTLTRLDLHSTTITDVGFEELSRKETGLKGLTSLNLRRTRVGDAGFKSLLDEGGLNALTSLDLSWTGLSETGVKGLLDTKSGLRGLSSLTLSVSISSETLDALKKVRPGLTVQDERF